MWTQYLNARIFNRWRIRPVPCEHSLSYWSLYSCFFWKWMIANDEILNPVCCDHRSKTPSAVPPHITIRPTSNSWVCGWIPFVWLFRWNLFSSTSRWYYRKSSIKPLGGVGGLFISSPFEGVGLIWDGRTGIESGKARVQEGFKSCSRGSEWNPNFQLVK